MPKSNISVIVSDLGNVLIPFDYQIPVRRFNEVEPGLGDKFGKFYMDHYHIHRSFEKGEMTEEELLEKLLASVDHKVDKETFCRFYSELFTTNDDVIALLPKLKEHYTLVLLSNTNKIHRDYGWGHYEFLKHFDKLILSYEVRAYKPEPEIYKAAMEFTGKPAEEHIFIDDVKEYVDAAKNLGWDGIHFTGYDALVEGLRKRNIKFE